MPLEHFPLGSVSEHWQNLNSVIIFHFITHHKEIDDNQCVFETLSYTESTKLRRFGYGRLLFYE